MDKTFFLDTLFDLINESDALETNLLDIYVKNNELNVSMKDGSQFVINIEEK